MVVIYIGGPFRAETDERVEENIRRAEAVGLEVARLGACVVVPHANTRSHHKVMDEEFMLRATMHLLDRCDAMVLVEGWETSVGTRAEIHRCIDTGKPVFTSVFGFSEWMKGRAQMTGEAP